MLVVLSFELSFRHYSMEAQLLLTLFTNNAIHSNIIHLKIPTLIHNTHIIHISVNVFLSSKFLPMKVRHWRPLLDTRYGNKNSTIGLNNVMSFDGILS